MSHGFRWLRLPRTASGPWGDLLFTACLAVLQFWGASVKLPWREVQAPELVLLGMSVTAACRAEGQLCSSLLLPAQAFCSQECRLIGTSDSCMCLGPTVPPFVPSGPLEPSVAQVVRPADPLGSGVALQHCRGLQGGGQRGTAVPPASPLPLALARVICRSLALCAICPVRSGPGDSASDPRSSGPRRLVFQLQSHGYPAL